MISYTGTQADPMYYSSRSEGIAPRLVVIHQSDKKHVTDKDIERLERNGFVVLAVEFVSKVVILDTPTPEDAHDA